MKSPLHSPDPNGNKPKQVAQTGSSMWFGGNLLPTREITNAVKHHGSTTEFKSRMTQRSTWTTKSNKKDVFMWDIFITISAAESRTLFQDQLKSIDCPLRPSLENQFGPRSCYASDDNAIIILRRENIVSQLLRGEGNQPSLLEMASTLDQILTSPTSRTEGQTSKSPVEITSEELKGGERITYFKLSLPEIEPNTWFRIVALSGEIELVTGLEFIHRDAPEKALQIHAEVSHW